MTNSGKLSITTRKRELNKQKKKRKKRPSTESQREFKMQMEFQGITWVAWNEPRSQVQLEPIPSLITRLFNDLVFVYKAPSVLQAGDPERAQHQQTNIRGLIKEHGAACGEPRGWKRSMRSCAGGKKRDAHLTFPAFKQHLCLSKTKMKWPHCFTGPPLSLGGRKW